MTHGTQGKTAGGGDRKEGAPPGGAILEIWDPAHAVLGLANLLLETRLDEEQHEYARNIRSSAEVLLSILGDLFDSAALDAGEFELQERELDLRSCCDGVVTLMAPRARDRGLELSYYFDPTIAPIVAGDRLRLRRLLLGVARNAVRFATGGGLGLTVEPLANPSAPEEVAVRFVLDADDPRVIERLAAHLFPASPAAASAPTAADSFGEAFGGGTPLRWLSAQKLIELMGGDHGVDLAPSASPRLWMSARFRRVDVEGEAAEAHGGIGDRLRNLRLLVADPSARVRSIVAGYARAWNVHLEEAEDSEEAMRLLRAAAERGLPFDVALIDATLGERGGGSLAKRVTRDAALAGTRIVFVQPREEAREEGRPTELRIAKPLLFQSLAEVLRAVATPSASSDPSAPSELSAPGPQRRSGLDLDVLLVEDNWVNQKVEARLLEKHGCGVDVASNELEALDALKVKRYDLLLVNARTPDLDGLALARAVRSEEAKQADKSRGREPGSNEPGPERRRRHQGVVLVGMLSNPARRESEECLAAGMDECIAKPLRTSELTQILALRQRPAGASETRAEACPRSSPLDWDVVDGLRELGGEEGRELFLELVDIFVQETPLRLAELERSVRDAEWQAVERVANALKSSAAQLGAAGLAGLCRSIAAASQAETGSALHPLLDDLDREFGRVRAALASQGESGPE